MQQSLLTEAIALLDKPLSEVKEYESTVFDRSLASSNRQIILFGAGNLGRKTLAGLRSVGIEPVAFSDNNASLWNQIIDGLIVLPPDRIALRYGTSALCLVTIWNASRKCRFTILRDQLKHLGCLNISSFMPLFWKFPDLFLPHYCVELPHKIYEQKDTVLEAFSLFKNDLSQRQYLNQLKWRVLLDFDCLSIADDPQYFSRWILPNLKDEVFIDCGAFDGDTVKSLVNFQTNFFKQIICFEPDPNNFQKLDGYVSSLDEAIKNNIVTYQKATGKQREILHFSALGLSSSAITNAGEIDVECVPLDEIILEKAPTFIKMDIEGAEIDTIIGATEIIKKYSPIIAMASYHLQSHLWQIPLLVNSIGKDYSFFLEQYGADGLEVVFYAVPNSRLSSPL